MKSTAADITTGQRSTSKVDSARRRERVPVGDADSLFWRIVRPVGMAALFLTLWGLAVRWSHSDLFPTPGNVTRGIVELIQKGLLVKYIVASVFRVSWGFALAVLIGVPLGLVLGWYSRAFQAFNPFIQILRPISPIAWIPVAILWFGVSDAAPIFLIFLASVFPITVATIAAVQNMQLVYLRAAQNFGLSTNELFRQVILRACLPQIITGIRIALGVAWLVVVAAEMIAVNKESPRERGDRSESGERTKISLSLLSGAHSPDDIVRK